MKKSSQVLSSQLLLLLSPSYSLIQFPSNFLLTLNFIYNFNLPILYYLHKNTKNSLGLLQTKEVKQKKVDYFFFTLNQYFFSNESRLDHLFNYLYNRIDPLISNQPPTRFA